MTNIPIAGRRLHEMYSLEDGEVLRLVPPPGIPERAIYLRGSNPALLPRSTLAVRWDGKVVRPWSMSSTPQSTIGSVLWEIGIERAHYQIEPGLTLPPFQGDWVVDFDAPMEQKLRAVEALARSSLGRAIRIEKEAVEREVIVARGRFAHKPIGEAGPGREGAGAVPEEPLRTDVALQFTRAKRPIEIYHVREAK